MKILALTQSPKNWRKAPANVFTSWLTNLKKSLRNTMIRKKVKPYLKPSILSKQMRLERTKKLWVFSKTISQDLKASSEVYHSLNLLIYSKTVKTTVKAWHRALYSEIKMSRQLLMRSMKVMMCYKKKWLRSRKVPKRNLDTSINTSIHLRARPKKLERTNLPNFLLLPKKVQKTIRILKSDQTTYNI